MDRRQFTVTAAAAAALGGANAMEPTKPAYIELRRFQLRNTRDAQRARFGEFLSQVYVPALVKSGAAPVGVFSPMIGADAPYALVVAQHATLDEFDLRQQKIWSDAGFVGAAQKLIDGGRPFERMEVTLLRGFAGFPAIELSKPAEQGARVFELRRYESDTPLSLKRKIAMFENGEIALFRQHGLTPVFFGEQVAGAHAPNLTYMVVVDNLAAREANWRAFATSPEWRKMAATPGLSDGEVVSNISNTLLTAAAGSQIR